MDPNAYGYRPKRSAQDAIQKVHELSACRATPMWLTRICRNTSTRFRTAELMQCVARRIVDRDVLHLIKMWLKVPVEERDENGKRRMSGGKNSTCGTPQGGVISPLLANLYMNRFLKYWRITGRVRAFRAQIVNYADDFVILSRGHAAEALDWTRQVMTRLGLTLNETKTSIEDARTRAVRLSRIHVRAASHSEGRPLVFGSESVEEERAPDQDRKWETCWSQATWHRGRKCAISSIRILRGWSAYFSYGTAATAYRGGRQLRL